MPALDLFVQLPGSWHRVSRDNDAVVVIMVLNYSTAPVLLHAGYACRREVSHNISLEPCMYHGECPSGHTAASAKTRGTMLGQARDIREEHIRGEVCMVA